MLLSFAAGLTPRRGGRKAVPALSAASADELRAMDSVDLGGLPELDDFEPGLAFDSLLDGPANDEVHTLTLLLLAAHNGLPSKAMPFIHQSGGSSIRFVPGLSVNPNTWLQGRMMSAGPPPQQMSAALAMQRRQQAEQAQAQALYNARLQVGAPETLLHPCA